jgi:DNA-binding transcriptional LysR family regulator
MPKPDFNLLITLDVLLAEGSVARAAQRLRLSPSAMSRTLARLRQTTGDPLLVRAGRGLVPTPRAFELRGRTGQLVQDVEAVLRPAKQVDLTRIARTFTLRTREGFVENFGSALVARVRAEAPGVRLCFLQKTSKESTSLRDGSVDLETGVVGRTTGPEIRSLALFRDRFVGVVRKKHTLSHGRITPARFAAGQHVSVAGLGIDVEPIEEALGQLGLEREIVATVSGYAGALTLARAADLIASVPERHTGILRAGLRTFQLPFPTPEITVSLLWHPRLEADPVHRWLRGLVEDVCTAAR